MSLNLITANAKTYFPIVEDYYVKLLIGKNCMLIIDDIKVSIFTYEKFDSCARCDMSYITDMSTNTCKFILEGNNKSEYICKIVEDTDRCQTDNNTKFKCVASLRRKSNIGIYFHQYIKKYYLKYENN